MIFPSLLLAMKHVLKSYENADLAYKGDDA